MLSTFFILLTSILLNSCDPRGNDDMFLGGIFQIKVKVLNQQDSLNLGDTLKVIFEIPDTISLQSGIPYSTSGSGSQLILTDKISCSPYEVTQVADSTTPGGLTNAVFNNSCQLFSNPGYLVRNTLNLAKVGNRLIANYYILPTRKGIFALLNADGTGGYFEGSSTSGKIKSRIVFDFDVANKHHNLLQPAIGVNNNLTPMITEMASHGQGVYVFAVK